MLKTISLENFKGVSKADIELSNLNLFVGENGTGKSTIFQALSVLRRSLGSSSIITELPYLNLGSLDEIVQPAKTAAIGVHGDVQMDLSSIEAKNAEFDCKVRFDTQGLYEYETEISPKRVPPDLKLHNVWTRYGVSQIDPANWQYRNFTFNFGVTNNIGAAFSPGGYSRPAHMTPETTQVAQNIYQSLAKLSLGIRTALENVFVVPPTRGLTEPSYPLQPSAISEFSPRAGPVQMGAALASNLTYFSQNQDKISTWLQEVLGVGVRYYLEPGPKILIRNPDNNVSYVNEGFGSNQMLFVLERIANSPEDSFVAIEEPEIHIHPKAQFKFGLLACQIVKEEKKQLAFTTHSEHVISGVLTAIRNGKIEPDEVTLWFFERKGFENIINRSKIDKEGKTSGALRSFLEATVEELSEYTKGRA